MTTISETVSEYLGASPSADMLILCCTCIFIAVLICITYFTTKIGGSHD